MPALRQEHLDLHAESAGDGVQRVTVEVTRNPEIRILVATDAAGERLNLQRA